MASPGFECISKTISLPHYQRGCHLVTDKILKQIPEISKFKCGILNVFLQHTSASLTINENCCSSVRSDLDNWMNKIAPEGPNWEHSSEGPDDMPAHVKSSLMGVSLNIPITDGKLNLGTWQGIYLNEHRNHGGPRTIVITISGMNK